VPEPKFQLNVVPGKNGPSAEILTFVFKHAEAGAVMLAVGGFWMVTLVVAGADEQPAVVTVKLAVEVPADAYVTACGPAVVADAGVAPTPKFQLYVVPTGRGAPVIEYVVLVPGQIGVVDAAIATVGAEFTVIF
jgi:hypothetical protein